MAPRDIASALDKARGQCGVSKRAVSASTERLPHAYAALRTRALSGGDMASLFLETVEEPRRRWGRKTGGLGGGGICGAGRKGLLPLSTSTSARDASGLAVWRALRNRGLQTPVTIPTAGAPGVLPAVDSRWPRSRRMRGWFQKRPPLHQQVPPQAWPACKAWSADRREAPTFAAGQRRPQALLAPYRATLPAAGRCREDEAAASRKPLQGPARHRP
jgi:transposase-like protein